MRRIVTRSMLCGLAAALSGLWQWRPIKPVVALVAVGTIIGGVFHAVQRMQDAARATTVI